MHHRRVPQTRSHGFPSSIEIDDDKLEYMCRNAVVESDESSDEDSLVDDDLECSPQELSSGFFSSLFWSLFAVVSFPLLFLDYLIRPFQRNRYPLGCYSRKTYFLTAMMNVLTILFLLYFSFWLLCDDTSLIMSCPLTLQDSVKSQLNNCLANLNFQQGISEQCLNTLVGFVGIIVVGVLLVQFHKSWVKHVVIFIMIAVMADWMQNHLVLPLGEIEIVSTDPEYALVNEKILVVLEGEQLKEGMTVSWIPYWKCAKDYPFESCERLSEASVHDGTVMCEFPFVDSFIPCIGNSSRDDGIPELKCFNSVKIRVKDQKSIPGWN